MMKRLCERLVMRFTQPSQAVQSEREACDINNIIRRYRTTGILPVGTRNPASSVYADCVSVPSFEEAQDIIANAKSSFEALPVEERAKFGSWDAWLKEAASTIGQRPNAPTEPSSAISGDTSVVPTPAAPAAGEEPPPANNG